MWSKRDRVMAVLSGERPDRVPVFECVAHDGILERYHGGPIPVGDAPAVLRACREFLDLCHPALVPQAPATTNLPNGGLRVAERWNTWERPAAIQDMEAALKKEIETLEANVPVSADVQAAEFRRNIKASAKDVGDMVYIHLCGSCAILPFDMEQGAYAYADYPELVRRWNMLANARLHERFLVVADGVLAPVCIIWNDIACKQRLLLAPAVLEEFLYPALATLTDICHSRGVKVLFHSDGDVTRALSRLVDCGIDGFNPLEISAGMRPADFKAACGRRVALVGGIDAVDVLARGTPAQVAAATRALIDLYRNEGNLMMASASGEIDNSMPTDNIIAMLETAWQYGKY